MQDTRIVNRLALQARLLGWVCGYWSVLGVVVWLIGTLVISTVWTSGAAFGLSAPVEIKQVFLPANYQKVEEVSTASPGSASERIEGAVTEHINRAQLIEKAMKLEHLAVWVRSGNYFDSVDPVIRYLGKETPGSTHIYYYSERLSTVNRNYWLSRGYMVSGWQDLGNGQIEISYAVNWWEIVFLTLITVILFGMLVSVVWGSLENSVYRWYHNAVNPPR